MRTVAKLLGGGLTGLCLLVVTAGAAEPSLDLRTPTIELSRAQLAAVQVDDRPNWVQTLDSMARHGLTFLCLRPTAQGKLILGAHPDGYIGVFTAPRATPGRRGQSC